MVVYKYKTDIDKLLVWITEILAVEGECKGFVENSTSGKGEHLKCLNFISMVEL
ncbi:predicted protein [Botrytis cinerea T4]|uniref:Uncharacterized protein n=1 Tax=Botryotinia fuckeliana (strain T4) TaxID=999810 RepID=G2XYR7_BOTF4|nr:predicted protein [Botrytis cinerea T4]